MKKFVVILLVLAMLVPYTAFAHPRGENEITEEQYAAVEEMWQELVRAAEKKGKADASTAAAAAAAAEAHELYVKDTLRWNGDDHFTFETTLGVTCGYSARLYNIAAASQEVASTEPEVQTRSYARGDVSTAVDVYLIEPYYQIDESFTKQYQKEAQAIAEATGGTYHLYTRNAATIDAVADAMESGAVVIFDSHGDTDFARGSDYTSGATTSYLLLQTGSGLTTEDYENDNGTYHAVYYGSAGGGMKLYAVDGTCIANHMEKNAPSSLVWMAICLGMATDGLHAPLREKGVEVAYGYSQSVTFDYDYMWEEVFFDELIGGANVASAIATMKKEVGLWDCCDYYDTIQEARIYDAAFPIVVSSQDVYPGHGNVDNLQTVYSTWSLFGEAPCGHENVSVEEVQADCLIGGYRKVTCNDCGMTLEDAVYEALGHDYVLTVIDPTCEEYGADLYACSRCGDSYTENETAPLGHVFENCVCILCDGLCPCDQLVDVSKEHWFHDPVLYAIENGLMNGVGNDKFDPEGSLTRAMLVTILYRNAGEPSVEGMENPFADVKADQWYTNAIIWAADNAIVNGTSETTFAPNQTITREQIAAILYRHSGKPDVTAAELEFADANEISDYALGAMCWAVECSLIQGMGDRLAPTQSATRAQIAVILMRYIEMQP